MRNTIGFVLKKENKCYCSKCKEEIIEDKNNPLHLIKQYHEKHCNLKFVNFSEPRIESDIFTYNIFVENDVLVLHILQGLNFDVIYEAKFRKDTKMVEQSGEEDILYWKELLKENFFYDIYDFNDINVNEKNYIESINEVFPMVGYVSNLSEFIEIYLNKGFKEKNLYEIAKKIPVQRLNLNLGKSFHKRTLTTCFIKEYEVNTEVLIEVNIVTGICKDGKLIPSYKDRIIISDNFIYNPKKVDLDILNDNIYYGVFSGTKFSKRYPHLKLQEYISSGGKKIVPFILSSNNDIRLEVIGKAGLGYISDNYKKFKDADFEKTNIKKMFGLSIKALKCLNSQEFINYISASESLDKFKKLYKIQPMVFTSVFTKDSIEFIKDNVGNAHPYVEIYEDKDVLKYINYIQSSNFVSLSQKKNDLLKTYMDYLNLCSFCNLYPGGKFPNDIIHYHDLMCMYRDEKRASHQEESFGFAIANPRYKFLGTWYPEMAIETNKKEQLVMLLPRKAADLVSESYNMNNCVRTYVSRVASGSTYILFLRYINRLSTSFVTVEVNKSYDLIQVKASHNRKPSEEVAEFIRKWAKEKDVNISRCRDVMEVEK